jgi:hypothetical protein
MLSFIGSHTQTWTGLFLLISALLSQTHGIFAQSEFEDAAIRLELLQSGNAARCELTCKNIAQENIWPENPHRYISPFNYGDFQVRVLRAEDSSLIYKKGFDTLFTEYASTQPAIDGKSATFELTVRIPKPKSIVKVIIDKRAKDGLWSELWSMPLDPKDAKIQSSEKSVAELQALGLEAIEHVRSGPPQRSVDLVFLAEGYMKDERQKFIDDMDKMTKKLFESSPYKEHKAKFNIVGVFGVSKQSGTDIPHRDIMRDTLLSTSFNTLGIQRYLLLESNHLMHRIAALVPHDHIIVLVNSTQSGGGSIRMDFCVTTTGFSTSPFVFLHELGHGLAYLADEYIGNVTYNGLYPEGIEPPDPNLTRELDATKIKWRRFLTSDVALPTPLSNERRPKSRIVGAFEGGGYVSKGIYRSEEKCWMGHNDSPFGFCIACEQGILDVIDYYTFVPESTKE